MTILCDFFFFLPLVYMYFFQYIDSYSLSVIIKINKNKSLLKGLQMMKLGT